MSKKIIRAVTVSMSCDFYSGMIPELQERGYEVVSLSAPGPELQEMRDMGIKVLEVNMERHISLAKDIRSLFNLIAVFRKEKPYMVHSMTPKAGLLCMLASWICRIPRRVHTFTGLVWPTAEGMTRKLLMATDWITCACATHIIPEGEGVKEDLQKHITKKDMKVLGYGNVRGIDMERFSRRPEVMEKAEELKSEAFTFLFVGRIVGDKGINELIKAFTKLNNNEGISKPIRLFLVGDYEEELDPLNPETKKAIKDTPEIIETGSLFGDDLLTYFAASDCFVFPSYREGFPNTVLEAGAMGIPSIVTDINGSREIIVNGKNGIIIPSQDANELYHAMVSIITEDKNRQFMAANARKMIETRFEQNFVRKCLYDFYGEIM